MITRKKEQSEVESDPAFPYFPIAILCMGLLAHCMVFTAPLPYVAFMMVDFHMAKNVDEAGYTAGWITGMFMVGRLFSGIPWGMASDKFGRKMCMFISLSNLFIFGLIFGFSTNFYMATIFRFCIGIGNGFMGIAKTYISEITQTKEHEVRAFGYFNGVFGVGMVIGPVIGGMLARPAIQYPSFFPSAGLFGVYPYLLPSVVCSCLAITGALGIFFFLPETLKPDTKQEEVQYSSLNQSESAKEEDTDIEMVGVTEGEGNEDEEKEIKDDKPKEIHANQDDSSNSSSLSSLLPLLRSSNIRNLLFSYMSFCFLCIFSEEVFPLYAVTSVSNGGLAWSSMEVGEVLALSGLVMTIYQFLCYEKVLGFFFKDRSNKEILVRMLLLSSAALPLLPFFTDGSLRLSRAMGFHASPKNNVFLKAMVVLAQSLYNMPSVGGFTYLTMLTNASTDPAHRGRLNGLVATAGSLGNLLGPIVGSSVYALAITLVYGREDQGHPHESASLPIDGRVVFLLSGVMCLALSIFVQTCVQSHDRDSEAVKS